MPTPLYRNSSSSTPKNVHQLALMLLALILGIFYCKKDDVIAFNLGGWWLMHKINMGNGISLNVRMTSPRVSYPFNDRSFILDKFLVHFMVKEVTRLVYDPHTAATIQTVHKDIPMLMYMLM